MTIINAMLYETVNNATHHHNNIFTLLVIITIKIQLLVVTNDNTIDHDTYNTCNHTYTTCSCNTLITITYVTTPTTTISRTNIPTMLRSSSNMNTTHTHMSS